MNVLHRHLQLKAVLSANLGCTSEAVLHSLPRVKLLEPANELDRILQR